MSFFSLPKKEKGGQRETVVSDENLADLLNKILKELKKMNLQLSIITDTHVTNEEIQNG